MFFAFNTKKCLSFDFLQTLKFNFFQLKTCVKNLQFDIYSNFKHHSFKKCQVRYWLS